MSERAIEGVFVAAVTPRRPSGHEIDLAAAFELIDYLGAHKVDGIALLGSTGEFVHFDIGQRVRLTGLAVKRSRLPVCANVSHSTLEGAVELGQQAARSGAAALMLMPPYFFRYSQDDILEFYARFACEMPTGVPLLVYNIPFFTSPIEPDTALALLGAGPWAGIKDSSGRFEYYSRVAPSAGCFVVGNDVVYTRARSAGASGVISGVACAVPELVTALDRAIRAGATDTVARLDGRLHEFIQQIGHFPVPIGVKEAVAARGIHTGPQLIPLAAGNREGLERFREWFRAWLPEVQRECRALASPAS